MSFYIGISVIIVFKFILVLVFISFFHQSFLFLYYTISFDIVSLACVFHTNQLTRLRLTDTTAAH